ncbi:MAG TPA: hypothetical protein VF766_01460 [Pyrinomonadaceae bacterium]
MQNHKADQFFNAAQQERLTELMQQRKAGNLSPEEKSELESLVKAELDGAQRRLAQMFGSGKEAPSKGILTDTQRALIASGIFGSDSPEEIAEILNVEVIGVKHELAKIEGERDRVKPRLPRQRVPGDPAQGSQLDKQKR